MNAEPSTTAVAMQRAQQALEIFHEVHTDEDGALSFLHGDIPCAVQAIELSEGLEVLSLTCVVAWDLAAQSAAVGELLPWLSVRAGQGLFGTLGAVRTERGIDVTLRYTFPAAELSSEALGTLLMLVVSSASQVRGELNPDR